MVILTRGVHHFACSPLSASKGCVHRLFVGLFLESRRLIFLHFVDRGIASKQMGMHHKALISVTGPTFADNACCIRQVGMAADEFVALSFLDQASAKGDWDAYTLHVQHSEQAAALAQLNLERATHVIETQPIRFIVEQAKAIEKTDEAIDKMKDRWVYRVCHANGRRSRCLVCCSAFRIGRPSR